MKVRELKERCAGTYDDDEFYVDSFEHRAGLHTDRITDVDGSDDDEVLEYEVMGRDDYEQSILAN